jgi:hypothetical protein
MRIQEYCSVCIARCVSCVVRFCRVLHIYVRAYHQPQPQPPLRSLLYYSVFFSIAVSEESSPYPIPNPKNRSTNVGGPFFPRARVYAPVKNTPQNTSSMHTLHTRRPVQYSPHVSSSFVNAPGGRAGYHFSLHVILCSQGWHFSLHVIFCCQNAVKLMTAGMFQCNQSDIPRE